MRAAPTSGNVREHWPTPVHWLNGETIDVTVYVEEAQAQREDELRVGLVVPNRLEPDEPLSLDEARIPQA